MEKSPLNRCNMEGADDIWGDNHGFLTDKNPQHKTPQIKSKLVPIPMKILHTYSYAI